jgi:transcriptional regulator with XRE-family HTH domain
MPNEHPLQRLRFADTVPPVDRATISDRIRVRLEEEMRKRNLSQTDVAGFLKWTQPRVSKILHGKVELGVEELAALCFAIGVPPTEMIRDRGMEFCAEMTPTELRVLEMFRSADQSERDLILRFLAVRNPEERRAAPPRLQKKRRA